MKKAEVIIERNAIERIPGILKSYSAKHVFILADKNTYNVAGVKVSDILKNNSIKVSEYVFQNDALEPDEFSIGSAVMHFDEKCDMVVGVGSGVINDIGKILCNVANKPYIIVGTAPSMDGYASGTSSVARNGLKISLNSKCADVIIGDLDVLVNAPKRMLKAGLGDMLAKYVSICEWRIAHILVGENYSEEIANKVRLALKSCVDNSDGLLKRDYEAVKSVFEGLIICGEAMAEAGLSRPASGIEHYFSHIWDMRGLEFGTKVDFHGIQCAIGTLMSIKIYEEILKIKTPDKETAYKYVQNFSYDKWSKKLTDFLGKGAISMIELEAKEGKYDLEKYKIRFEKIVEKWDEILKIIKEELPTSIEIEKLLDKMGMPKEASEIGIENDILPMTFKATKDIRDKYVLSRLCWDLGIIDEVV